MKKLYFAAGCLVFLCNNILLHAFTKPEPGHFGLQVEWVYLCPMLDDTYYAVDATSLGSNIPNGTRYDNNPDFHSGFRLEGIYAFCTPSCFLEDLRIRWTRLGTSDTDSVTNSNGLVNTNAPSVFGSSVNTFASSKIEKLYQNVELLAGMTVFCCCDFSIDLRGGVQYAYIRLQEKNAFSGNNDPVSVEQKAQFTGVGPEIGFEAQYGVACWDTCYFPGRLSIVGLGTAGLLAARNTSNINSAGNASPVIVKDEQSWKIVPSSYVRAGLNYETCFCCLNLSLEIGYEIAYFYRALGYPIYNFSNLSRTLGNSFQKYRSYGVHGPYISLGASF